MSETTNAVFAAVPDDVMPAQGAPVEGTQVDAGQADAVRSDAGADDAPGPSAATPRSMRAAVLTGVETIDHRRIAAPVPGPGDLLVRVRATGICGSDLAAWRGTHPYKTAPAVLGHEFSGVVEHVGAQVSGFEPGDLVCSAAFSHCDACPDCLRGAGHLCAHKENLSHLDWTGSFAELVVLRPNMTHRLPAGLDPVAGALVEPLSIARHAMRRTGHGEGRSVLVLGSGTIGLGCLIAAKRLGYGTVACVDLGPAKGGAARRAGADSYVDAAATDPAEAALQALGGPADVVVIAAGYPGVTDQALKTVRPGGDVVVVSYFADRHPVDLNTLVGREVTVHGSALSTAQDFADVIAWLAAGEIDPLPLATDHFPLSRTDAALRRMADPSTPTGKIVLHPDPAHLENGAKNR
ncbi:zinc-binding dehydrogenase [Streptomyces sp. AC602_WCS936]|uniref:zinc-dependent alcohol dehydrogenase n=1 Tax=Streptomyces sp. AC602_WCS936 TaxID=2823685 RepID=UPI0020B79CCB|nr:alcohol dehydrogenase catalytic domain-containing protein [Streptomyces sp. AC602_WCS936]